METSDELHKGLKRVGWLGKLSAYETIFTSVEYKNKIERPALSVIIISWRYVPEMKENFLTLQAQRKLNFELVFVNNGKDDREFEMLLPYVDTYVKLNCNSGAYKARNIGSVFATAPILVFLEDDGIPEANFVKAHLDTFKKYDIISARGVYKPLNPGNPFNKLAKHYSLGQQPFPRFVDLEGNASYEANAFYSVGGWDDDINFGHGGPELAIRLLERYPDRRLQIYSPELVIYHDYVKSEEHLKNKSEKQIRSKAELKIKHPHWDKVLGSWGIYQDKPYLLKLKNPDFFITVSGLVYFVKTKIKNLVLRFF